MKAEMNRNCSCFFQRKDFRQVSCIYPNWNLSRMLSENGTEPLITKGTRTSPFTSIPKSQNEAHAAAAKCYLFPTKCYRSRWKPATPWWLSATPSLEPLLSLPALALPQDSREHHWPCAIYSALAAHLAVPTSGENPAQEQRSSQTAFPHPPNLDGLETGSAGNILECSCASADRDSLKGQDLFQ